MRLLMIVVAAVTTVGQAQLAGLGKAPAQQIAA